MTSNKNETRRIGISFLHIITTFLTNFETFLSYNIVSQYLKCGLPNLANYLIQKDRMGDLVFPQLLECFYSETKLPSLISSSFVTICISVLPFFVYVIMISLHPPPHVPSFQSHVGNCRAWIAFYLDPVSYNHFLSLFLQIDQLLLSTRIVISSSTLPAFISNFIDQLATVLWIVI